ncbi:oligoendopeptidase, M3 family [Anaerocolumna jejuensis DSM 15929]|uniref:Oligoendopeptidase, M3 family n=1 Tax=Anaerocolumna jejuensis DSM 15929 TaxID=1121322 RepID=A0A1M6JKC2_9FIRM|nr:M3 family oligoendopeptidase [Anaerocolumna jejuensis]SHJ47158.1 oligoendopeptidase, M3 family [Anaerocolumna jejuensis DSM 15929]
MEKFTFSTLNYQRPDFDGFEKEYRNLAVQVKQAESYKEVQEVLQKMQELSDPMETMSTVAFIRNSLNTTDEFYEKEVEFINNRMAEVKASITALGKEILASRFTEDINKEYGKEFLVGLKRNVDQFREEIIPYLQEESKLTLQYQKLMATAQIPFEGEALNLYGIQKHFEDSDRNSRKAAFQAYSDFYHQNEEEMENIFDKLIKVRNEMGKALGYENYIPLGYMLQERSDYGVKEVEAFREQVRREIVPLCETLYEAQRKRIGVKELMVYDEKYKFTDGNAEPIGDEDYLIREAQKMYHEMSPETGGFIDFMIEHELMDLKNKPNKASTGYMTILHSYKAPYVFSCFNHTIFDMQVLTHELGHAFAGYEAMREQKTSRYYMGGTDIAEIHSMSMEQFAYPYAEYFFGDAADKYRFAHLQDAITFVPFGVAVDEFQHIVYANPDLTPKERTLEWHKLEEKYMPWRKYEKDEFMERGGYWYHKLHIFLYPFYYINYTLTTMGAMEFKKRYLENKEQAWKDYLNLCKAGSSKSYLELLKAANLSVPFEEGSVANAISCAKEILLKSIEDMKA